MKVVGPSRPTASSVRAAAYGQSVLQRRSVENSRLDLWPQLTEAMSIYVIMNRTSVPGVVR
jgi:hypothetical protein